MNNSASRYLVLQTEPTPYFLGLVRELKVCTGGMVDTLFLTENSSQPWNLSLEGYQSRVLPSRFASAAVEIWRAIRSGKYRVVYVAGWGEPLMRCALLAAWFCRIPVVVESDTPLPEGQPLWKRFVKAALFPLMFKIPAMMLPFGNRQCGYFRHYGVEEERITVINFTVDVTAIFKKCSELGLDGRREIRARLGFSEDDIVFVFVGRLYEFKGIRILLDAFARVAKNSPHARLLVVGDGPDRDLVRSAAERDGRVVVTGRLDTDGVIEMYHAADVSVVPSLFEPFGLVVHESMAAGLPVVCTDRVGCSDNLLLPGGAGLIVPAGDTQALTDCLTSLLDNPERINALGRGARATISTWTLENCAAKIVNVWQKVCPL